MESNHTNWYAYECDQQHIAAPSSAKIPPYPTNEQRKTVEVNGEEVISIPVEFQKRSFENVPEKFGAMAFLLLHIDYILFRI